MIDPHRVQGTVGLALTVLLVFSLAPALSGAQAEEGATEAFRITTASTDPEKRFEAFDAATIAVFDLDGDGSKEIIAHNDNNNAYVFSASGELIAEIETPHPDGWGARELAGVSVGDVNGNGAMDLVITNSAGYLTAFEVQSTGGDAKIEFHQLWQRFMDPHEEDPDYQENHPWVDWNGQPGLDGAAYLADATGDGRDEIYLQLDDTPSLYALDGSGEVMGWNSWGDGNANPVASDLTGDGRKEVLYPSDGGKIFVFDAATFDYHCSIDMRDHGPTPASISVSPTVVDLTGDGRKEIVFGVRHAVEDEDDDEWYNEMNAHFFAVTADCQVLWQKSWDWGNPHSHMHPIPVDVDDDGALDLVFQDWNTIGHKPGDWEVTGNPNLFAVEGATGELIWQVESSGYWSNDNLALADVTGDGQEELLVVAEQGGEDGLMRYSLQGEKTGFIPSPAGWFVNKGPSVIDLDDDGESEIVLPIARKSDHCTRDLDVGCREGALQVYSTSGTGAPTWPNVKLNNDAYDDKDAPSQESPVATEPEPTEEPEEPDDDRPGAPRQMDALRSGKNVDLVWKAPEGDHEITGYTVYRSTAESGPFEEIVSTSGDTDQALDEDVPEGDTWYYQVTASNEAGEGEPSRTAKVEPPQADDGDADDAAGRGAPSSEEDSSTEPAREPELKDETEDEVRIRFVGDLANEELLDPLAPLVVEVQGDVSSVTMRLDKEDLPVESEGQEARHTPEEPLEPGDHTLTVIVTGDSGDQFTESIVFRVKDELTLESDPSNGQDEPSQKEEGRREDEPLDTPLGAGVGILAVAAAALLLVLRRRTREE